MDINDPRVLKVMRERFNETLLSDDHHDALVFVRNVDDVVPERIKTGAMSEEVAEEYYDMQRVMKYVCLPSLPQTEIIKLFKEAIAYPLLDPHINLKEKLKTLMLTIPEFSSRDALRAQLKEALAANEERIGESHITVSSKTEYPTIGNWIRKYISLFGNNPTNTVQLNQFFVSDRDVQKLDPEERHMLRELVDVYEYLKFSSQTPEGLEDPLLVNLGGDLKVLRGDKFEDIKPPAEIDRIVDEIFDELDKEKKPASGIAPAVAGSMPARQVAPSFVMRDIALAAHQLLERTNGDAEAVRNELDKGLRSQKTQEVLGSLLLLVQLGRFDRILVDDERFRKIVETDLRTEGRSDKLDGLRINPRAPHFLARFLKVALEKTLSLDENSALDFGSKLDSLAGGTIGTIVITEGESKRWNV